MDINRRSFLAGCAIASASLTISSGLSGCTSTSSKKRLSQVNFSHGVASGDPQATAVILWTRALPLQDADQSVAINWEISSDSAFTKIVRTGQASTNKQSDYTVKIDVQGLQQNSAYYYRFIAANGSSRIGRAKTLPSGNVEHVKMAVVSCSNYPAGYFNAYAHAAKDNALDIVLHLGDYIYEYDMNGYATENATKIGRALAHDNNTELFVLDDYRKRYALYRTDHGLQDLHAHASFIAVWDDHEVTNDTYKSGAQNHNEGEGDFFERRVAAIRAYYEWMPIRPPKGKQSPEIYRQFNFGNLLSLYMLDTRIIGRDKQLEYANYRNADTKGFDTPRFVNDLTQPSRALLGKTQLAWLTTAMSQSKAKWQVLGQQVLMAKMMLPTQVFGSGDRTKVPNIIAHLAGLKQAQLGGQTLTAEELASINTKMAYNLDAWDGYPVEREKLYASAQAANKSLLVLAGDTHNAWHSVLTTQQGKAIGAEFATPSVSSPGMEYYLKTNAESSQKMAKQLPLLIDDLQYCNLHQRGYMTVTLTPNEAKVDWVYIDQILSPDYEVADQHSITYKA
ncbi:MAG: alkaline phosphatase D family protein [Glaciecola sp.]